jgi:hypothetical protein
MVWGVYHLDFAVTTLATEIEVTEFSYFFEGELLASVINARDEIKSGGGAALGRNSCGLISPSTQCAAHATVEC